MANIQYYDVILKPVITEKSMNIMADKKNPVLHDPFLSASKVFFRRRELLNASLPSAFPDGC